MKAYILLEDPTDLNIIRMLLPSELLTQTTLVPAGRRSNLTSMARSLLVTKRKPLAVIIDADTVDEVNIQQRRQTTEELIQSVSGGVPFKVVFMVPEIEVLFFMAPYFLERLTGQKLSTEIVTVARTNPKQALKQLFNDKAASHIAQLASEMTEDELDAIRETSPAKELIGFLTEAIGNKTLQQTA